MCRLRRSARLIGAALVCAWTLAVRAAEPPAAPVGSFVHISEDEGLAHSDVRAITQDHEGFIWLGLRLGGLTRYDGYELKVHQHDPADGRTIGNEIIWALLNDRHGTLWIGTEGGLDRYDRATDTFTHLRHDAARSDSLGNNVVTCLFEDAGGRLWVGTREGLCRLDDPERGSFTTFLRPQVVPGSTAKDTIRSITEDTTTGLLWLGMSDGLAAFDPRTGCFASYVYAPDDPTSLGRNAVNKVIRDERGVFWALTEFGLDSFRPTLERIDRHTVQEPRIAFRHYVQPGGAARPGINFVRDGLVDRQHRLWLATRGGVYLLDRDTGVFTGYRRQAADPRSLSDDLVQSIFEDRAGTIWVGTYAGGVNRLRSEAKPFHTHRHQPGDPRTLSEDRISGLAFDPAGRLWASTVNGLNRLDASGWTRWLNDPADPGSLPTNDLSTVATAPDGDIWVGSNYRGVYRFDQHRFQSFPTSPSNVPAPNGRHPFTGGQVNSILPDANGGVWLGARAYGLDHYSDGAFLHFNPQEPGEGRPEQPTTNVVLGLVADNGDLWFATELSGLVRYTPGTQEFRTFAPPISRAGATRSLHCIAAGAGGTIWLGAANGLLQFDVATGTFVRLYTPTHGLPHAAVMTIVRDRRDHLWLGTANGLADFDPATGVFRTYDKADGLPASVFSQRAGVLGPDGRVYLGTRAGIVDFAPEALRDNPVPPPVVFTELRWLGPPPPGTGGKFVTSVPHVRDLIHVPAGQLGFSLRFSALDFAAPEKNRFRYRLEGWEDEWISTTSRERSATYTALPPGTYTFRVQASNADRIWNEQGAAVRIVVAPHFWQTPWFRGGAVLGGLLLIGLGLRWRTRAIRRHNALLELQVSARTAELRQEVAVREGAEAALRQSHAELESRVQARTAELAQTNASLQAEIAERHHVEAQLRQSQKMEAIGQLAGGIAHDFNNLLTVILGQTELLGDPALPEDERAAGVHDIKAAAQRATNLTRQLLVFSRHQAMHPTALDLNDVVAGIVKLLRHIIGGHIVLEVELSPAPLGVLADRGMLEQVLLNMAVNARDAMVSGGRLALTTAPVTIAPGGVRPQANAVPGDYARISVIDTGTGIAAQVLPQIFEPFFTTKESGKGTGLGLAISLGIVQQHRGWIEVDTRADHGSTFHVYLPAQPLFAPPLVPDELPAGVATEHATVLVAEDETAVRTLVQHVLKRHGYRVIHASSGEEALARWQQYRDDISILLTDIVMPGWPDGHALAALLLREKPALRVVTMSGYDPGEVASRGGLVRPHVRKPFTAEQLLGALANSRRR